MSLKVIVVSCFLASQYQVITSQCLRQPLNLPRSISQPLLSRQLSPIISPITSPTIITDCTPRSCQNLADTLQLMIVCNLLENTNCGCNDCNAIPISNCGCISPSFVSPSVISNCGCISPSVVSPSMISNCGCVSPSVISPNFVSNGCNCLSSPYNKLLSLLSC